MAINVFKAIYNYPHSKDLFFRVHSHAFNSFIFTLLCENRKRSLILSDAVAEITELWEAELLDSLILINVVPRISVVVPFLINVVAEIAVVGKVLRKLIAVTSRLFGREEYVLN